MRLMLEHFPGAELIQLVAAQAAVYHLSFLRHNLVPFVGPCRWFGGWSLVILVTVRLVIQPVSQSVTQRL